MTREKTFLVAVGLLAAASSAMAAPLRHHSATAHRAARGYVHPGAHLRARAFEPYSAPHAYGWVPFSPTEERWFDRAKGNIW